MLVSNYCNLYKVITMEVEFYKKQIHILCTEFDKKKEEISILKKTISELNNKSKANSDPYVQTIDNLKDKLKISELEVERLNKSLSDYNNQIKILTDRNMELENQYSIQETTISNLRSELIQKGRNISDLTQQLQQQKDLEQDRRKQNEDQYKYIQDLIKKDLEQKYNECEKNIRNEYEQKIKDCNTSYDSVINTYETRLNDLDIKYQNEIEELKKKHVRELNILYDKLDKFNNKKNSFCKKFSICSFIVALVAGGLSVTVYFI